MRKTLILAAALVLLPSGAFADGTADGTYLGQLIGSCRAGMLTLTVSGGTLLYHPSPGEEGTASIQPDGAFKLAMISNGRFPGSTITIDGKMSDGKITGEFVAAGSFKCVYSFTASLQVSLR